MPPPVLGQPFSTFFNKVLKLAHHHTIRHTATPFLHCTAGRGFTSPNRPTNKWASSKLCSIHATLMCCDTLVENPYVRRSWVATMFWRALSDYIINILLIFLWFGVKYRAFPEFSFHLVNCFLHHSSQLLLFLCGALHILHVPFGTIFFALWRSRGALTPGDKWFV